MEVYGASLKGDSPSKDERIAQICVQPEKTRKVIPSARLTDRFHRTGFDVAAVSLRFELKARRSLGRPFEAVGRWIE